MTSEVAVRVLSVPSEHAYVQHIRHPAAEAGIRWVPGPDVGATWGPPVVLQPQWVAEHADTFDVVHLHFGFDELTPQQLTRWAADLRARGKALVYTVHDLRNPHHRDPGAHDAQLGVLVTAADAVLTLTPGAAGEVARRWGRRAVVVRHPQVVPDSWLGRPRPVRDGFVVGVHLKSLRANVTALPVLRPLAEAVRALPDASLVVDVHDELTRPQFVRHDPVVLDWLRVADARGDLMLRVHDRFGDDQLWDYLSALDLSVLPYAFGTHSGWLEACHDLGTTVLAPRIGYWHEQQPCLGYDVRDGVVDAAGLQRSVADAHRTRPAWRADPDVRRRQRRAVAEVHRDLYHRVHGSMSP